MSRREHFNTGRGFSPPEYPMTVFHGTGSDAVGSIRREGFRDGSFVTPDRGYAELVSHDHDDRGTPTVVEAKFHPKNPVVVDLDSDDTYDANGEVALSGDYDAWVGMRNGKIIQIKALKGNTLSF